MTAEGGKTTSPDTDVRTEIVHVWKADFSSYCLVPNHTGSKYEIPFHFHGSTPPVSCSSEQSMRIWNPCSFNPPELCLISCCCSLALTWKAWLTFHKLISKRSEDQTSFLGTSSEGTVFPWWACSSDLALWFLNLLWTLEQKAHLKINIICCCASCNPQWEVLHPPLS